MAWLQLGVLVFENAVMVRLWLAHVGSMSSNLKILGFSPKTRNIGRKTKVFHSIIQDFLIIGQSINPKFFHKIYSLLGFSLDNTRNPRFLTSNTQQFEYLGFSIDSPKFSPKI